MRLDKYLANATALTRSQARRVIRHGRVLVNGEVIRDFGASVPETANITLDGRAIGAPGPRYLMLNKPAGVVSVTEHEQHPTVLDLLDIENLSGLHAAGRLDLETTGLVLITDDGDWSHRITSRRTLCPKVYRVWLDQPLDEAAAERLRSGVMLHNDERPTLPAEVERIAATEIRLTLTEGRYHQVKRMLAAVGNHVVRLHREAIGAITLDAALEPGEWRYLTQDEINRI